MIGNNKLKNELSTHSATIDTYMDLGVKDIIDPKFAMEQIKYHQKVMLELMIEEYGIDVMTNIMLFIKENV